MNIPSELGGKDPNKNPTWPISCRSQCVTLSKGQTWEMAAMDTKAGSCGCGLPGSATSYLGIGHVGQLRMGSPVIPTAKRSVEACRGIFVLFTPVCDGSVILSLRL